MTVEGFEGINELFRRQRRRIEQLQLVINQGETRFGEGRPASMEQLSKDIHIPFEVFRLQAENDNIGRKAFSQALPAQECLAHAIGADAKVQHFGSDANIY